MSCAVFFLQNFIVYLLLMYEKNTFIEAQQTFNFTSETSNNEENATEDDSLGDFVFSTNDCNETACKDLYEQANYPYSKIKRVIAISNKIKSDSVITPDLSGTERSGWGNVEEEKSINVFSPLHRNKSPEFHSYDRIYPLLTVACKEIRRPIYPIKGKSTDGKMYYITNIEGFSQRIYVITCHKTGSLCGDVSTIPESYNYRCQQIHEDVELFSFPENENITRRSHGINTFKLPRGCVCDKVRNQH